MKLYHRINRIILAWFIFCTLAIFSIQAYAQVEVRKYSNEFLGIGVGARAAGMGNAMTAATQDVTAAYWNPAGLLQTTEQFDVGLMHSEYFAGIAKYDYGGLAYRVDSSRRIGFSVIRFGIDNISNTLNFRDGTSFDYARITKFSIADYAFILSYAQRFPQLKGLDLGGNVKLVHRSVGPFASAWGFGFDVGAQYQRRQWRFGLTAHDLTGTFNAWTFDAEYDEAFVRNNQEVPQNSVEVTLPSLKAGAAYLFFPENKFNLLASADVQCFFDGKRSVPISLGGMSIEPRLGLELSYKKLVFIRTGVYNLQNQTNDEGTKSFNLFPTAGIGLAWKKVSIDYALSNLSGLGTSLYSHLISLRYAFNTVKFTKGA